MSSRPPTPPDVTPAPKPGGRWVSQRGLDLLETLYDRAAEAAAYADSTRQQGRTHTLRRLAEAVADIREARPKPRRGDRPN